MYTLTHGSFDNWFCLTNERWQRINGADIEGDRDEWAAIAGAIEKGLSLRHKRCAAELQSDGTWHFWSPRNSMSPTVVSAHEALHIASEIRRVLAETPIDAPTADGEDE